MVATTIIIITFIDIYNSQVNVTGKVTINL